MHSRWELTDLTAVTRPAGRARALELAAHVDARAAVLARARGARVVYHLTVVAGESLGTGAAVLVGPSVFAGAAIDARLVGATEVEICGRGYKLVTGSQGTNQGLVGT